MTPHFEATAIVLAGGRSSRMGTPKALLPFARRPLIWHIVERLAAWFTDVVVVAAPGQELPALSAVVVEDEVAHQGPVGGICYGLTASRREINFVTSCDSAFLNVDLIASLVQQSADCDVVVPHWNGRLQPLHAVYRRSVLPLLQQQLVRGELRPITLFDKVRTRTVHEAEIRELDPDGDSFFNMNSPEDYAQALVRWDRRHGHDAAAPADAQCVVELFGVARMLAGTDALTISVPADASCSHVFAALAERCPALAGRVVALDGTSLTAGYACNVNGLQFVRDPAARVNPGDRILILAADAGG